MEITISGPGNFTSNLIMNKHVVGHTERVEITILGLWLSMTPLATEAHSGKLQDAGQNARAQSENNFEER